MVERCRTTASRSTITEIGPKKSYVFVIPPQSLAGFEELDAVTERVAKLEPFIAGNLNTDLDRVPRLGETTPPGLEISYSIGKMALGFVAVDTVLGAEVDLE